ncbi:transposase [Micromonospora sp. NPDC005171]|uniref:transposase n=1 Tax=Micromonospora sp. NPDC005171 TaxID=3156866 RepID=UPI0033BD1093
MSQIEKITGELRALMTGVERAQGLAAAADSQAQEVALRAAGAGFVAVAAGVARVRNAITGIQGGLGILAGSIGEATKATAGVPNEASPQETIAGLAPARPWLTVIRLPAYAPDLNPTEGVWRWMKRGLTNTAARGVDHLAQLVKRRLRACQQQTDLLAGFLASTGMTLDPEPPR